MLGRSAGTTAADGVSLTAAALEQVAALGPFFADTLRVPNHHGKENSHDEQVEEDDAGAGEQAEELEGLETAQGTEGEGERVGQRGDRDRGAGVSESLVDTNEGRVLQVCLIDCVAHDEHVIDADADEQERNQDVNARLFRTTQEHEAEASRDGKNDAHEADEGHDAAAVDRAKVSEGAERVNANEKNGDDDQALIVFKVGTERLEQSLDAEDVDRDVLGRLGPLLCHFVHLLLPAEVRLFVDVRVAVVLDNVSIGDCTGLNDAVLANVLGTQAKSLVVELVDLQRRILGRLWADGSQHLADVNEAEGGVVDERVTLARPDLRHVLLLGCRDLVLAALQIVDELEKRYRGRALYVA